MRRYIYVFAALLSIAGAAAQKLPKDVAKARQSMATVLAYDNGELQGSGTAFFLGDNGELLAPYSLIAGADSAVVIDTDGKVREVKHIVGVNEMFNCVKLRVAWDKKIRPLAVSGTAVSVNDNLYMLSYGAKKSGAVETVRVSSVDSVYSCAYYALASPMKDKFIGLPLLNGKGELVAFMQPAAARDTVNSYAVGAYLAETLLPQSMNYGRGYYPSMRIRTALPLDKEAALSCLYMQSLVGDSISYAATVEDYIALFPNSYEGYLSKAEYVAVYRRDMDLASSAWENALSLAENDAEVYFAKAKVLNAIVQSGDTVSSAELSYENAMSVLEKAIETDNQPLYVNYKADMLLSRGEYAAASQCYESLALTSMRSPELFAKASQCQNSLQNFDRAVELLDSAINCFGDNKRGYAPYLLTRAIVKATAKRYREAVFDFNTYEQIASPGLGAAFYYMREQAEVNGRMYQQALNDIETAIYLDPQNVLYYVEKGLLCYRVKMNDEGIRTLEEAKKIAPEAADVYYLLGKFYIQNGDKVRAVANLEQALSLGHPDAAAALQETQKKTAL